MQRAGASRLLLAKTSGLGMGPEAKRTLDDRSSRGAMGGMKPWAAIPQAWRQERMSLAAVSLCPVRGGQDLWLVSGCARCGVLIGPSWCC